VAAKEMKEIKLSRKKEKGLEMRGNIANRKKA